MNRIRTNHISKNHYGCKHDPLLNIPLDYVNPDELHLLSDRLLQNIDKVMERDTVEDFNKASGQSKRVFLTKLAATINESMNEPFSVWNKMNAEGSDNDVVECTSLLGVEKIICFLWVVYICIYSIYRVAQKKVLLFDLV